MKTKVSIILPVMNECKSLIETLRRLFKTNSQDIYEIIIMISPKSIPESVDLCQKIKGKFPQLIKIHKQKLPYLGGAMRDAFQIVRGDYALMMASDLETNPDTVPIMIKEIKKGNWDIVTASRWIQGGGFKGYNPAKYIANWIFQKFFSMLYGVNFTDMTYGFRLFKTSLIQNIRWEELKHPFLLETLLKPIKLGCRIKEVPSRWQSRAEGQSSNSFWRNFQYFPIAFRVWGYKRKQILKNNN